MTHADSPGPRAVVRRLLGFAGVGGSAALGILFLASGRVEWPLVALIGALWSAWSLFDSLAETVVLPAGRFLSSALMGSAPSAGTPITMEEETALLERFLAAQPVPHRAILAGIRLAEIYRTHQRDAAKADALIAQLVARYPDASELQFVRPSRPA